MIRLILYYIVFALQISFWGGISLADKTKCVANDASKLQCSENEVCVVQSCECLPGFVRLNDICVKSIQNPVPSPAPYGPQIQTPDAHNSHVAAAIIIPIMLILFVIGTVVLVRKYNVLSWVRNKINQRQSPYDEVMIGQDDDDPPLSGV